MSRMFVLAGISTIVLSLCFPILGSPDPNVETHILSYFDLNKRATPEKVAAPNEFELTIPLKSSGMTAETSTLKLVRSNASSELRPVMGNATGNRTTILYNTYVESGNKSREFTSAIPGTGTISNLTTMFDMKSANMSLLEQLILYFGILIGVVFSSAVRGFSSGNMKLRITGPTLIIAAVVALVIIPNVYQMLAISPDAPFIVQLGLFVQNGVFWEVILGSASKAAAR